MNCQIYSKLKFVFRILWIFHLRPSNLSMKNLFQFYGNMRNENEEETCYYAIRKSSATKWISTMIINFSLAMYFHLILFVRTNETRINLWTAVWVSGVRSRINKKIIPHDPKDNHNFIASRHRTLVGANNSSFHAALYTF
jgi:hypothetical protein